MKTCIVNLVALSIGVKVSSKEFNTTSSFQAEACRSVAMAMKKCPHGMYAEIKYDGERVQVHKQGEKFEYFSRSLKTVQPHKVSERE